MKETQEQLDAIENNTEVTIDEQAVEFEMEELEQNIAPGPCWRFSDDPV